MLETEKNKRIRELENELGNEKKHHLDDNTEWAMKLDALTKNYETSLSEQIAHKNKEIEEKEKEFQNFIEKLRKVNAEEMKKLNQRKEEEKQESLKELLDRKNLELEESKKLFEKKFQRLSKSFDNQLQEKIREFETKFQSKEEKLQAELKAHQETKKDFLIYKDEAEKKIKGLEEMTRNMRKFQDGLQTEIKELKEEIVKIRSDHEYEIDLKNQERNKIAQKYQEKEVSCYLKKNIFFM